MKTLALIPARSGSKGIVGKNVREFCGRPLLAWAVEVGKATCDLTYVSTDSHAYADIAAKYGARVIIRPAELASDETPMLSVVSHALEVLETVKPDAVVILQPTQPRRTAQHVIDALAMLEDRRAHSVVSVVEMPATHSPDYAMRFQWEPAEDQEFLVPFLPDAYRVTRRQEARKAFYRDGTVYAIRREVIESGRLYGDRCVPLVIPPHESVILDTEDDWQRALMVP